MGETAKIVILLLAAAAVAYFVASRLAPQQKQRPKCLWGRNSKFWQPQGVIATNAADRTYVTPVNQAFQQ